jgi:hypothetical protein
MNIKGYQLRKPEVWQWLSGSLPIHLLEYRIKGKEWMKALTC